MQSSLSLFSQHFIDNHVRERTVGLIACDMSDFGADNYALVVFNWLEIPIINFTSGKDIISNLFFIFFLKLTALFSRNEESITIRLIDMILLNNSASCRNKWNTRIHALYDHISTIFSLFNRSDLHYSALLLGDFIDDEGKFWDVIIFKFLRSETININKVDANRIVFWTSECECFAVHVLVLNIGLPLECIVYTRICESNTISYESGLIRFHIIF